MTAPDQRDRCDDVDHAYHRTATPHDGAADIPVAERWPSEMKRPEPDAQAAEIERHQSCTCEHHQTGGLFERHFCAWCGAPWPCLVRRLADERDALLLAGNALAEVCLAHAEVIRHLAASKTLLRAVDRWTRALAPGGEGEE